MFKRKFTVVTQLHENNNQEIIDYIDSSRGVYAKALRETFYGIKNSTEFDKSKYNNQLQSKWGILKRTANSIIADAQGRLNALKELKVYEQKQLESKIQALEEYIQELQAEKADNCAMLRAGASINLTKHRNLRRKLVAKQSKLNQMKQRLVNLQYQIDTGHYKLCFGTKKLLNSDKEAFIAQRDSQMSFVGTKTEVAGNQLLQLTFLPTINQFGIKLRKDIGGFKNAEDKYVYGRVYFNHHADKIKQILQYKNSPLSFKIIKRNGRMYLYCTFEIQAELSEFQTRSSHGTIGLDFNKGFVTLSETNQYGHLVQTQFLPYRFKAGHKTDTDLQLIVKHVVELARNTGKDVCVENLDFKIKKSKTQSKKDRTYNAMLHSLAYRTFINNIEQCAHRYLVYVRRVNPAWTSWLAKQLYCPTMKLNTHVGASYVIARRGQGFKDAVK